MAGQHCDLCGKYAPGEEEILHRQYGGDLNTLRLRVCGVCGGRFRAWQRAEKWSEPVEVPASPGVRYVKVGGAAWPVDRAVTMIVDNYGGAGRVRVSLEGYRGSEAADLFGRCGMEDVLEAIEKAKGDG